MVDGLVQKYAGRYDIKVMNLSSGDPEYERLAQSYGVEYVPTFVFLNSDGSKANTLVGAQSAERLEAELVKLR